MSTISTSYDPTRTLTTGQGAAAGNPQQLLQKVALISPQTTPLRSLCSEIKATNRTVEYLLDTMRAPKTTGKNEGVDNASYTDQFAQQVAASNNIQIYGDTWAVSQVQNLVTSNGPANRAQAEIKATIQVRRDIEASFCSENDKQTQSTTQAWQTRGLGGWVDRSIPSELPTEYLTPAASIHSSGTFDEDAMNDIITSIFRQYGESQNLTVIGDTEFRQTVSNFHRTEGSTTAKAYNVNQDAGSGRVTLNVEFYESQHGIVSILNMNPDCAPDTTNKDTAYFINPELLSAAVLKPMMSHNLENQGGGERGFVECIEALIVKNPLGFGKVTALS